MRAALLGAALLLAACGGGDDGGAAALVLDGSARIPDDEGVATTLDFEEITLDGERTYGVSDELRSFSTYTLAAEPMVNRRGQYVQVGLDGDTVVWMAGIAAVVPQPDGTDAVFYAGRLAAEPIGEDGRATFVDGTTFAVSPDVELGEAGAEVLVQIDPAMRQIVAVRPSG